METLSSSKIRRMPWTDPAIPKKKHRLKQDYYRIATFKEYKYKSNSRFSPTLLGTSGFSYDKTTEKIWCEYCQLTIKLTEVGIDPKFEHINRSPSCPFVVERLGFQKKQGIVGKELLNCSASNNSFLNRLSLFRSFHQ